MNKICDFILNIIYYIFYGYFMFMVYCAVGSTVIVGAIPFIILYYIHPFLLMGALIMFAPTWGICFAIRKILKDKIWTKEDMIS